MSRCHDVTMSRTVTVTSSMCAAGAPGCQLLAILTVSAVAGGGGERDRKWWKYKPDKWRYFMFQLSTLHTPHLAAETQPSSESDN